MRRLNNVLYVTTPDLYLSLEGENVVLKKKEEVVHRIPLHNLEGIITFGYTGASPGLMGACAKRSIALTFLSSHGRFLARISGEQNGNVLLRKAQYRFAEDIEASLEIAKNMVIGKIYNSKWVIERAIRDYAIRFDTTKLKEASMHLSDMMRIIPSVKNAPVLLGIEGECAKTYFQIFGMMILQQKDSFQFTERNKRPPLDNVNALLSFTYTLLAHDCASALESAGLDAYVGFYHKDRPGRISLALDIMEEFRSVVADRFVLSLINKKMISDSGFTKKANGAVIMDDETRKVVLTAWQNKKNEKITHPYLAEKMEWGIVPFAQAQLLARYLRGDIDEYPPFFWK